MPRGLSGVREVAAELQSSRNANSKRGPSSLYFSLKDGEETIVRFLEQDDDIAWCWTHEIPVEGRAWGRATPCLDQQKEGTPCPGCERDMPRKFMGYINLIWDDAPVFKRDDNNRIVRDTTNDPVLLDNKPQVAIWQSGIRLFEELDEINANYKGLMSRKFKIKRKGSRLDTKYMISPADIDSGAQDLDAAEVELSAAKFDLTEFITAKSYDEFTEELTGGAPNGGNGQPAQQQGAVNPFMRNR